MSKLSTRKLKKLKLENRCKTTGTRSIDGIEIKAVALLFGASV